MKEELYVYDRKGARLNVELGCDTKITLKWENNLFKSIDKVSCSYSYTFKVPLTRHNSEVFDLAEDVRRKSDMAWKKLKCEFIQNGIPLFRDANLYVSKVQNGYSCVFTWGVLDGLQKLSDDSVSLQELRTKLEAVDHTNFGEDRADNYAWWGDKDANEMTIDFGDPTEFNNTAITLHPNYWAGFASTGAKTLAGKPPLPVMPVKYILNCINKAYGSNIQLGKEASGQDTLNAFTKDQLFKDENIVTFGCLPLVKAEMTDTQLKRHSLSLKFKGLSAANFVATFGGANISLETKQKMFDCKNIITFSSAQKGYISKDGNRTFGNLGNSNFSYIKPAYAKISESYGVPSNDDMNNHKYIYTSIPSGEKESDWAIIGFYTYYEVKIKGSFVVKSNDPIRYSKKDGKIDTDNILHLKVKRLNIKDTLLDRDDFGHGTQWEVTDETTINNVSSEDKSTFYSHNVFDSNGKFQYSIYYFNFDDEDGYDNVSCGTEGPVNDMDGHNAHFYFFSFENATISEFVWVNNFVVTPQLNDAKKLRHEMDTFSNLPDIDCLAFVKSLFYAMGEYPYVTKDGVIKGSGYAAIEDAVKSGDVYDWSKKVIGSSSEQPEEMTFQAGDFKQFNYYLSKWDDLDRTEDEWKKEQDVYEDGVGCLVCNNESLDYRKNTIYTFPFYTPYIINRKSPSMWTGESVKFWTWDYPNVTYKECKPAYGILTTVWPLNAHFNEYDKTTYKIKQNTTVINGDNTKLIAHQLLMMVLNPFANMKQNPNWAYLQRIIRNPKTITENLYLNEVDLANLDLRKPVYIGKYSSYFTIVSIQRNSDGICKCELLKLPKSNDVTITLRPSGYQVMWKVSEELTYPVTIRVCLWCSDSTAIVDITIPKGEVKGLSDYKWSYAVGAVNSPEVIKTNTDDDNRYSFNVKDS